MIFNWHIILQIKPAVANPRPVSFVSLICLTAVLENIIPIMPNNKPTIGINNDKIPIIRETIALLLIALLFVCTSSEILNPSLLYAPIFNNMILIM